MSRELFKMNMIASVQKLDNEDIEIIQNYIKTIEQENKQLKEELKSANEEITWWSNRFNAVERNNRQLKEEKKKAIEYINTHYLNANEPKLLEILGDKE